MPDNTRIEYRGVTEAARDLHNWTGQVGPDVAVAARDIAQSVASQVQGKVPVVSGALAASVQVIDSAGAETSVGIGGGLAYAGWIEFGGSRGRPLVPEGRYLYPTAIEAEPRFIQAATQAAETSAARYPWSTPTR
jgi:hypothetical protein